MARNQPSKKLSLDQVLHLVELLPAAEQEELRRKLNRKGTGQDLHPFLDWHIDIDQLATEQGVAGSTSVDRLKGDFWPPDEDLEEFVATIRQWRSER